MLRLTRTELVALTRFEGKTQCKFKIGNIVFTSTIIEELLCNVNIIFWFKQAASVSISMGVTKMSGEVNRMNAQVFRSPDTEMEMLERSNWLSACDKPFTALVRLLYDCSWSFVLSSLELQSVYRDGVKARFTSRYRPSIISWVTTWMPVSGWR